MRKFFISSTGQSILNSILRIATLCTRFAFIFIIARFFTAKSIGYYGLFTAAVAFTLLLAGLDFYTYTTREITKFNASRRGLILKNQLALVCIVYTIVIPSSLVLLPWVGMPKFLMYWFFPVLFLEHVNQEIYRLLIILNKQLYASIILFIRQGSWAIAVIAGMSADANYRNLDSVMAAWVIAGLMASGLGANKLRAIGFGGWREKIDWAWIGRGVAISGGLLSASLAIKGIQTVDRYWLEEIAGIKLVGAYVLFFGLAGALSVFLDAAVFSFKYPELIHHANLCDYKRFKSVIRTIIFQVSTLTACFVVASVSLLPSILSWIGNPLYSDNIYLYNWVLSAMVAYSLSLIPHYGLYSLKRDRSIVLSHLIALPVFAVTTYLVLNIDELIAIPVAVLCAMSFILIWKSIAYWVIMQKSSLP